jgi:hypothetical protein
MWVYRSAEECVRPVVLFDCQPGHGQEYPQAFLAGYQGLLMTDGYTAWRTLEGPPTSAAWHTPVAPSLKRSRA